MRHRVIPGGVENAKGMLTFLAEEISRATFVNVMAQYRPHFKARTDDRYEAIGRRITRAEYREVLEHARSSGLRRVEHDPRAVA